jgi:hypothetical protein
MAFWLHIHYWDSATGLIYRYIEFKIVTFPFEFYISINKRHYKQYSTGDDYFKIKKKLYKIKNRLENEQQLCSKYRL